MSEDQKIVKKIKETTGTQGKRPLELYFPSHSLTDSLRVPKVIWELNSGNPFTIMDIAKKLNYSPTSGSFAKLLRSSNRYGLTDGS